MGLHAVEHDVAFVPGEAFFSAEPDRSTLRLSYSVATPELLTEGARRLARAFDDLGA